MYSVKRSRWKKVDTSSDLVQIQDAVGALMGLFLLGVLFCFNIYSLINLNI